MELFYIVWALRVTLLSLINIYQPVYNF